MLLIEIEESKEKQNENENYNIDHKNTECGEMIGWNIENDAWECRIGNQEGGNNEKKKIYIYSNIPFS